MPKPIGAPITITNGQPQREVTSLVVSIFYDAAGVKHYSAIGYGLTRLRDASGNIILTDPAGPVQIGAYLDGQIGGPVRTGFDAAVTFLDTQ